MTEHSLETENYLFLRLYSIDLDTAMHSLDLIEQCSDPAIRVCLLRDLVVTYARPFSSNVGLTTRGHRVDNVLAHVVPVQHSSLHERLMRYRNQLFAHTDLEAYGPKAAKWGQEDKSTFPMTFWALDYQELNSRLSEIRELVSSATSAVDAEIHRIHALL
jgi:hypothetical protein